MSGPPRFECSDLRITAGADVAFVTARGLCCGPDESGRPAELEFRLTMGLRKHAGQWLIEHEHHSVPSQ
jgi:ketosteroid isomerase-like protein